MSMKRPEGATPQGGRLTRFKNDLRSRLDDELRRIMSLETDARASYLAQLAVTEPDLSDRLRRLIDEASDLPASFLALSDTDVLRTQDHGTSVARPSAVTGKKPRSDSGSSDSGSSNSGTLSPKDRYRVEKLLGTGGMAKVYLARDEQLGRRVALKLLDQCDEAMRRRFLREARSQARVDHPNVLEIYETGEFEGRPYIAMRYVEGCTLLDAMDELSIEEKVDVFCQICEGLHAAHRKGLLHRDVKPANVLVEETPDGFKPYVADFGIAVAEEPESTLTTAMAGTPAFIAPERLVDGQADRRSDIYSLGVTMYQIFTGELPFAGESLVDVMHKTCFESPTPPCELTPGLPRSIETVILKCMAKNPNDRYASARMIAHALRGEEEDGTEAGFSGDSGGDSTHITRAVHIARDRPAALLAALGALSLAVLILVWAVFDAHRREKDLSAEVAAERLLNGRLVELFEAPPGTPLGEVSVRALLDRGVHRARQESDPVLSGRLLAEIGRMYRRLGLESDAKSVLGAAQALLRIELGEDDPEVARLSAELEMLRR